MAITGIKSVDFIIKATGEGVVNHNGSFSVYNPSAGKSVNNHLYPKLRGLDPMQRLVNENDGYSKSLSLSDPAISDATLIVSAECVRSYIFRDASFGISQVNTQNVESVLASLHGLVRGYLITDGGRNFARKSCLYVTDFECENPGLSFNQGTNSKVRGTSSEDTSLYSYFRTGKDLNYTGKATVSIEDLQFIPLENSLGRSAFDYTISVSTGHKIADRISQYISDLSLSEKLKPEAKFLKKIKRAGAVSDVGDAGILLNDDALRVLLTQIRELIERLFIRQGKGYMQVNNVVVDYNDTVRVFRAADNPTYANEDDSGPFAQTYLEQPIGDDEFKSAQVELAARQKEIEDKKAGAKKKKVNTKKKKAPAK